MWFHKGYIHNDGPTVAKLLGLNRTARPELFANFTPRSLSFGATLARDTGGSGGWTLGASAAWRFPLSMYRHSSLGVTATFASRTFTATWFGISSAESVSSGPPQYSPQAGLESIGQAAN
jgi:outer membrane scaffolding protein for murein synthesis (MipA/OmpV family)